METVVDEKPLSFATSRIVIVAAFIASFSSFDRIVVNHLGLNSCGCWRTLQQRVQSVSSSTIRFLLTVLLLVPWQAGHSQTTQLAQSQQPQHAPPPQNSDPQQIFQTGEAALKSGDLDNAEHAFRGVLAINPQVAGAYANLGVIYMRRKQWTPALEMLQKAEGLAPQIAGIRLNIGLVYYRQNNFRDAIPPFESVVNDVPDTFQARYLVGLCYFFVERYADAATTLEPLWSQASSQLNYLYVLGIAANKAGRADVEQRALAHLVEIGQNSPEFHLLMGKAHLNREEYDEAITELELAAKGDSTLPFIHFNLGMAYLKKQDLERAKSEFLKDIAIEPDVSYDYDQLGEVYYLQQQDRDAEEMFRKALRLDPQLASSHFQLARVYQRENKFADALAEADAALKLDPDSPGIHYLRGQVLQRLGRVEDAKTEMQTFTQLSNAAREKRHQELESGPLPNPELTQEPQ
jgi:tetratricopeptide (TPR) repeat protein